MVASGEDRLSAVATATAAETLLPRLYHSIDINACNIQGDHGAIYLV